MLGTHQHFFLLVFFFSSLPTFSNVQSASSCAQRLNQLGARHYDQTLPQARIVPAQKMESYLAEVLGVSRRELALHDLGRYRDGNQTVIPASCHKTFVFVAENDLK